MAALAQLQQEIFDYKNGRFLVCTRVNVTDGSDTLVLPEGLNNSAHVTVIPVDSSHTAKSVSSISRAAHPTGVTVTMTGGTNGSDQIVVSLHTGNIAGL